MTAAVLDVTRPAESADAVGTELAAQSTALATRLAGTAITDRPSLEQAVIDRQVIGATIARVEEFFAPFKQMAHRLHRALCDRESAILEPLVVIDGEKKRAISAYKAEQDRLRREEERRQAEIRRREDEATAAAEAAQLEAAGETVMATAVLETALAAPPPVVVLPDATKGVVSFTRRWYWKYAGGPADVRLTPAAVKVRTMGLIPREFLMVDEKKVGAYARSMKDSGTIPGIEIYYVDEPIR
jgi:hypothetical protein